MADLSPPPFATHHPNWADVQALNILLMAVERQLVINKANEEAHHLHQENLSGTPNAAEAILLKGLNSDLNSRDIGFLEHYKRYILEGVKKRVPKQRA